MVQANLESLKPFSTQHIWWQTPEDATTIPEQVIAQVMNIGNYADMQLLAIRVGNEILRDWNIQNLRGSG